MYYSYGTAEVNVLFLFYKQFNHHLNIDFIALFGLDLYEWYTLRY